MNKILAALTLPVLAVVLMADEISTRKRNKLLIRGSGFTQADLVRLGLAGGRGANGA